VVEVDFLWVYSVQVAATVYAAKLVSQIYREAFFGTNPFATVPFFVFCFASHIINIASFCVGVKGKCNFFIKNKHNGFNRLQGKSSFSAFLSVYFILLRAIIKSSERKC